jgi:hypothetical protein
VWCPNSFDSIVVLIYLFMLKMYKINKKYAFFSKIICTLADFSSTKF